MITGRVIADLLGFKCSAHFSRMFKALLQMPDGTTTDITAGVVEHPTMNAATCQHLISVLL